MQYKRIISLVPSLTELLIDLGLKKQLVGRTRFCIHPEDIVTGIEIIGGTKNPNIEKILALEPDLVIANKEENRKEDVKALEDQTEVLVTEIDTVEDALFWINRIGKLTGTQEKADTILWSIQDHLPENPPGDPLPAAYFIWKDPWMTTGKDTYIHDVMSKFGLLNVYGDEERYPETTLKELRMRHPKLILLSSEPYPFKEKHLGELRELFPDTEIQLIDGEWFSWYGSRMIPAFESLNRWRKEIL